MLMSRPGPEFADSGNLCTRYIVLLVCFGVWLRVSPLTTTLVQLVCLVYMRKLFRGISCLHEVLLNRMLISQSAPLMNNLAHNLIFQQCSGYPLH